MHVYQITDSEIHCHEVGEGIPVLCIHGFPLDYSMWQGQYSQMQSQVRWIVPDLPGFGHSPPLMGEVTMARLADLLVGLLDAIGIDQPCVVCGLSMGGYIAWEILLRHRSRIRAAILADTRAAADTAEGAQGREATAQQVLAHGPRILAETMLPKLFAQSTHEHQPQLVSRIQRVIEATSREGAAAALRAMAQRRDVRPLLSSIDLPTLLVCGEEDLITPVSEMTEIAQQVRGSRLVDHPGSGTPGAPGGPDCGQSVDPRVPVPLRAEKQILAILPD